MKCEKCGAEILSGQLLCPKCGWEVQIVPEFESAVDIAVQDVMDHIADHVIKTQEEEEEDLRNEISEDQNYRMHLHSTLLTAIVIVIIVAIAAVRIMNAPPKEPITEANSARDKGDYQQAAEYYEEYVKDHPDDKESFLALGDCYRRMGRFGDAIAIYSGFSFDENTETNQAACRALVDIYIDNEDFHSASELLSTGAAVDFRDSYGDYLADAPEFSVAQDTYDQPIYVRVLYEGSGDVYYTLDGSDPDPTSMLYENPILLDNGVYTLKAVSVNPHGVMSDTVTSIYEIESMGDIDITPPSGIISSPSYVVVNAPAGCTVYYTTDLSTPTKDSPVCSGPIVIPVGKSTFRFLAVMNNTGAREEIVREYDFEFYGNISQADAVNLLIAELMKKGIILNAFGEVFGQFGQNLYSHNSIITINSNYYYLIDEYHQDPMSVPVKTGNIYCVDTDNGSVYRASVDGDGHYSVISM